jgi:fimbrial chaperone protein
MMGTIRLRKTQLLLTFIASLFCGSHMAAALSIEPLTMEMTTAGSGGRATLHIKNDSAQAVPIQLRVNRITLDKEGNRVDLGVDDNFLIIPDQPLVPPNTEQSIRVQWVGDADIPESQTYIITAEQLPVELGAVNSGIQIVMSYAVAVNVAPAGASGALEVVGTDIASVDGRRLARVTVKNSGNRHIFVSSGTARLSGSGWSVDLDKPSLRKTMGLGLLLPGKERIFTLDADVPNGVSQYTAEFSGLKIN